MLTDQVVVSLPFASWYSICHQPSSSVMSPGGLSPPWPYVVGSGTLMVISLLLNRGDPFEV